MKAGDFRHEALQTLPREVIGVAGQQIARAGIGHFDPSLGVADQGCHRQVLQEQTEAFLPLGEFDGGELAELQLPLAVVEIAAHQQREQQRGSQAGPEAEGDPAVSQHRLVLRRTAYTQDPGTAEQLELLDLVETRLAGAADRRQQGFAGVAEVLEVDAVEGVLGAEDAVHQVMHAESAADHAEQGRATLLGRGDGRLGAVDRHKEQQAALHFLVGFLPQPDRPGEAGLAAIARDLQGLPAHVLGEHVEAQGAAVAPVQWAAVLHHHVLVPRGLGEDAEIAAALVPDFADELVECFLLQVGRPGQGLDARIAVLQLQLVAGPRPLFGGNERAADHQAGHAAQDHFVGAHAGVDALGDLLGLDLEALLVFAAVARFQRQPLPEHQAAEDEHQGEGHQQRQQVLVG
ncbi:hypothetical protein D3C85_554000 [compost metagenome]